MGKTVAYVAAAVVFLGIGALAGGLAVWYTHPGNMKEEPEWPLYARCELAANTPGSPVGGTLQIKQITSTSIVQINGNISNLRTGFHGFHVHEYGVNEGAVDGCLDAKGHYNPNGYNHSAPNATERHVGDLGNIETDEDSVTIVDIKDNVIKLWGEHSIIGRSIVVHEGEDDLGLGGYEDSHTTGHAGGRVACCNIYLTSGPSA